MPRSQHVRDPTWTPAPVEAIHRQVRRLARASSTACASGSSFDRHARSPHCPPHTALLGGLHLLVHPNGPDAGCSGSSSPADAEISDSATIHLCRWPIPSAPRRTIGAIARPCPDRSGVSRRTRARSSARSGASSCRRWRTMSCRGYDADVDSPSAPVPHSVPSPAG